MQLLEVLLPNARLSHHGLAGAICLLFLVAAQDDASATANAQGHLSQRKGKGQNRLCQNPCWGAE